MQHVENLGHSTGPQTIFDALKGDTGHLYIGAFLTEANKVAKVAGNTEAAQSEKLNDEEVRVMVDEA
jgi:hypothetical protein